MTPPSIRLVDERNGSNEETNSSSAPQEEVQSNSDLYAPPAYSVTTTSGEASLDAEAFVPEKTPLLERPQERPQSHGTGNDDHSSPSYTADASVPREERPISRQPTLNRKPVDWGNTGDCGIRCSVLEDRPATWTVKKKRGMALSPLAAAVLLRDGILSTKQLQLVPSLLQHQSSNSAREPTDPLSAILISSYDVVGDVLLGAAGGPMEVARKMGPLGRESERNEAMIRQSQELVLRRGEERTSDDALMIGPKAMVHFGVGTYKGVRKIVETCIKTPMIYTHGLTRGFHNMPNLYGEPLRPREEVVDLRSGFKVGGKTLVVGTFDGIKDFFDMPFQGARKEGFAGAGKGFCKGFGNLVCNVGEAGCGIIGYTSYGIYKEIQRNASDGKAPARSVVLTLGEAEFEQATEEERRSVIRKWLQVQMRLR